MKLLDSNEIRQLRDVCVFEINGMEVFILKSATKPFNLLFACTCALVTEFADN